MFKTRSRTVRTGSNWHFRSHCSNVPTTFRLGAIGIAAMLLLAACSTNLQPSGVGGIVIQAFEAEDATIATQALIVRDDPDTSGGRALVQPDSIVSAASLPNEDAYIEFEVDKAGERFLWARVKGESLSSDAMFIGFNGHLERIYPDVLGEYVWLPVAFEYLEAGKHTISIGHAEPELKLDVLIVTSRVDMGAADIHEWMLSDRLPTMPEPTEPQPDQPEVPTNPVPLPDPTDDPTEDPTEDPEPTPEPQPTPEPAPAPAPAPQPEPKPAPEPAPPAAPAPALGDFGDLRGNPNFKASSLSPEAQIWYRRLWEAIDNPHSDYNPDKWARSDNLYTYARQMHTYLQTLLTAFRVTGDLKLLDEIDRLVEVMRSRLADSWRDTQDGTRQKDGYLNWVWRGSSKTYYGKDTNKLDEMKTHAIIASVAHALDVNRDFKSPGGRAYGSHADFWVDYLVNDFEAKWRERERKSSSFPIMIRPDTHTYYSWMKWHYYMNLLTGKSAYLSEANRMAGKIWEDIETVSTSGGTAYVWPRGVQSEGGGQNILDPTTYSRYIFADVVEFYFEGFNRWGNASTVQGYARSLANFVVDEGGSSGKDWFASDIGGGRTRGGIRSDSSWSRMDVYKFEVSPYAHIMYWDSSNRVDNVTTKVMKSLGGVDRTRTIYLPVGHLIDAVMTSR